MTNLSRHTIIASEAIVTALIKVEFLQRAELQALAVDIERWRDDDVLNGVLDAFQVMIAQLLKESRYD